MPNNTVKSSSELSKIRRAADIIDDVYDYIIGELKENVTEIEISDKILAKVLELGGSGVSFDTIVAFGAGGAEPHHVPTDRKLKKGMFVTIDMGAVYEGYCSDFTRTMAFGKISDEQRKVYEIVLEAYKLSLASVHDGVSAKACDTAGREYISLCGYGDYFIHGTGHGVGTLIHEPPTLNASSTETLHTDEVVTVEPGIYIKDSFGVRIENMVLVGGKVFSRIGVDLVELN